MHESLFGDIARMYEFECSECKERFPLVNGKATTHMLHAHGHKVQMEMVAKDRDGYHKDVG